MTDLQIWLKRATRGLCSDAATQVRREIEDHYMAARDVALKQGATPAQADQQALAALGDATAANDDYLCVLLTKEEAKMLRDVKRDGQFFRCRPALVHAFRLGACMLLGTATAAYAMDAPNLARILFAATLGLGMIFTVPTFPIYTQARSRVYRYAKWPVMLTAMGLANGRSFDWLASALIALAIFGWTDWVCASIRQKLPADQWPMMLYL